MNILNRRMFANGDVANANQSPSKMIDIPNLINYYVSQGFNSVDIKEMLPEVPMAVIESAVNALGGSVNPAIASPGADEFAGNINPFVEMQETTTLANQQGDTTINPSFPVGAASPELPSEADISMIPEDIRRYMEATAEIFDDESMVQGLKVNFGLSEEEARSMVGMAPKPDTTITSIEPSLEKISLTPKAEDVEDVVETNELPEVVSIGNVALGNNEFVANGKSFIIDDEFRNNLRNGNVTARSLFQIVRAEDFDAGPDAMREILNFIQQNEPGLFSSITPNPEGLTEEERLGSYISPESFGTVTDDVLRSGRNVLFDVTEGLASIIGGGIGGPRVRQKVKDAYEGTEYTQREVIDDNLAVLEENYGLKSIDKSLEEIAKDENNPEVFTFKKDQFKDGDLKTEVTQKEVDSQKETKETGTSADPAGTGDVAGKDEEDKGKDKKDADLSSNITVATENDQAEQLFTTLGKAFNSDANLRLMRNVGKGLTQYGNFAEGIGVGTAAASEERKLEEELDAKRKAELAAAGGIDITDRKKILDVQTEMNKSVRDYNNALAAQVLANEVLKFANSNEDLTSFASKVGATVDDLLIAAKLKKGTDVTTLSDTKRAQIALDILTNANIKEILGESGRTISNIDRDIAERIAGNLNMKTLQSVGELKIRLGQNLKNIVAKKEEAQRNIKSSVRFLAPYEPEAIDSEILKIYLEELGQQMPAGTTTKKPAPGSDPDVTFIDRSND